MIRIFVTIFLICLSSCIFAPSLDSIHKAGFTKSDRMQILGAEVKSFHDALFWGHVNDAIVYADQDLRSQIATEIRNRTANERIVESSVELVDFTEDGYEAAVEVGVRYFKIPQYVVNKRVEKERWRFTVVNGWKIIERKV